MDHYQKKQQQYARWNESVWNSIEKELSLFQKKVTDIMIQLGDITKTKQEEFRAPPVLETDVILGQQFYIDEIRPICVQKGYVPKKLPSKEAFIDYQLDSDQQQIMQKHLEKKQKVEDKGPKKGKKGGKNNQGKGNDQKMKLAIAKENFKKDINLVLASHSYERMQVEFGLKQEKIEVKLMTFFYAAAYIRKNRVNQKLEQSVIFQLINILIKIVRIFKGLKGPSFMNAAQEIEISPTLILDLKMCIDGLKDWIKYDNKTVITKYPKLVYYTGYDKYFPTLDVKPYKSQIQFVQAIKNTFNEKGQIETPLLILYKPMIGSGKTSASLALSQIMRDLKMIDQKNKKLQVVYCCVIGSVRIQVGRYAYNKQQKFALSAMEPSIKDHQWIYPKIINSWSCRNQQIVDLLISDAYCTYTMLDKNYLTKKQEQIMEHERKERKTRVRVGQLDRENVVLFIDEPTAFCKTTESPATRKIFDILANYPPKITVLSSATMPTAAQLEKTIEMIRRKNPGLKVIQIQSKQFHIGCQYCTFRGDVIFPHTGVKSQKELKQIIELLQKNAFLLRLYTGPSLFFLIRRCQKVGLQKLPNINALPEVRQEDILNATFKVLKNLAVQKDEVIEEVCKMETEQANLDFKDETKSDDDDFFEKEEPEEQQEEQEKRKDYVNFKKMLRDDAYKFLGGCLVGTSVPLQFAHAMFDKWVKDIKPIKKLMDKYDREQQALNREIKLIEDDPDMREELKTKKISKMMADKEVILDFPETKKINTSEHYNKYCKSKHSSHSTMLIKPVPVANIGEELIDQVDDFVLKLLFCGVAIYTNKGISAKYLDKVEQLASMNYLAYIITDESLCYGTNFPISNVILRDELAEKLNMNEMFQLIGRAGRVGQSWTARAFLQGEGVKKLRNYIHRGESQVSEEGQIFEQIAKEHLDYPLLKMRTLKSEIRYRDHVQNSDRIEILIKKKNIEESDLFKNLCVIPYIVDSKTNTIAVMCRKSNYKDINYYSFPYSELLYEDIPTATNSQDEQVIDIASYYKDEVKFITQALNRTVKRVIQNQLKGSVSLKNQQNQFKPKQYVPFFSKETNTFVVLIKESQQSKVVEGYQYRKLVANNIEKFDDIISDQLREVLEESKKLAQKVREHPLGLVENEINKIMKQHWSLSKKESARFYKLIFDEEFQHGSREYETILKKKGYDKSTIDDMEFKEESKVILTLSRCSDLKNVAHKNFHIEKQVRAIWGFLEKTMYGEK